MTNSVAKSKAEGSSTKQAGMVFTTADTRLHASATLNGISSADMQEIVEEGYKDLQMRLKAAGRNVVLMSSLKDNEGYKELNTSKPNNGNEFFSENWIGGAGVRYVVKNPKSIPLWFGMGDQLDEGGNMVKAARALSMKNFGNMKLLSGKGKAVLLDLSIKIDIAHVKSRREGYVSAVPALIIKPERVMAFTGKSTWIGTVPGPAGSLVMNKDYSLNYGNDYANVKANNSEKRAIASWEDSEKTIKLEMNADPAKFKKAVLSALKQINAAIAAYAKEYN